MNNDFFFYQEDGQTVGPVSGEELRGRIRDGKVRLFDLILREGDASWRMALEHAEFKADFKDRSRSTLRERPWVCLQRKSPDGFDFVTTGPFSQDEVREGLLAGRVSYSDYAWQSGFTEWKRIGLLGEFNPRLRQMNHEPEPVAEEEAAELLKKVVEMKRPRPPIPEPPPPEAVPQDLTKESIAPEMPPIPVDLPDVELPEAPEAETSVTKVSRRRRKTVPWLDWGIVVILVVVLGAVAAVLSRNIKRSRTLDVPATTVLETLPPAPPNEAVGYEASEETAVVDTEETEPLAAPEPAPAPAPAKPVPKESVPEKPEKKVSRRPTELYLAVQNRSKNQARVEVRTNGTAEFPVYVQVVGVPGSVSTGASFYSYLRVKPTGDVRKPLDLSRLKLPQGKLIFRANTGELRKEARLNLGTGDPQYKKAIGRVRKLHAYAIWRERIQLLRLSALLTERLNAAVGGQKLSTRGLEALNDVRLSNGHKFALFDDWYELKSVLDDGKKQANPALAARAKRVREKMASFSIWK